MDSAGVNGGLLMEWVIGVPWRIGENGPCLGMCHGNLTTDSTDLLIGRFNHGFLDLRILRGWGLGCFKVNAGRDGLSEPSEGVGK
jgi:hypothetical protein